MKQTIIATVFAVSTAVVQAASFDVTQEFITDKVTKADSTAQVLSISGKYQGLDLSLSGRTVRADTNGSLGNSLEVTAGRAFGPMTVYAGVGHDNGPRLYQYGIVGISNSLKVWGPVSVETGIKHRVNWQDNTPDQTVVGAGLAVSVAKNAAVTVGYSRSFQDIKENVAAVGLRVNF